MKFVYGKACLVLGNKLVAADLHLGLELELRRKKIFVPLKHEAVARDLRSVMKKHGCRELIVLGDAKHDVYGFELEERKMMREFVDALGCRVTVVKGNHDSELDGVRGLTVEKPQGIVLSDCGLFHGHALPSKKVLEASTLLCGHQHPLIEFKEKTGSWRQKIWLFGNAFGKKTIVFPAFSELVGGIAVNKEGLLGVLKKGFDVESAKAVLLDGTRIGRIIVR